MGGMNKKAACTLKKKVQAAFLPLPQRDIGRKKNPLLGYMGFNNEWRRL